MSHKILIIDENKTNRDLIVDTLSKEVNEYELHNAPNGKEGIEKAGKIMPDLIILDLMMPDISGFECLKRFHSNEKLTDVPVLVVTAYDSHENLKNSFDLGAYDYITKPIDTFELETRVKKTLSLAETLRRIKETINLYKDEMEQMEKMALVSSNTQNSFILIKPNGELEWANEGFTKVHGCTLEEFKNKYGSTIFSLCPDPEIMHLFNKCIQDKNSFNFISSIKDGKNKVRWIQTIISPKLNSETKEIEILIGIENDITTLKLKEEELHRQNQKLLTVTENLEKANALLEEQTQELNKQRILIEEEQKKSEELLLNILPFEVARQLKSKGRAGTRHYKMVSVLFTDFKGFSKSSKELEAKDLVNILDTYFAKFDDIIGNHYMEKIKTIGDAYMCAGGLPLRNKSNPFNAVLAGLEIQNYMNVLNDNKVLKNLSVWELRLGIHTGEVVAGVVGKKKFAYDIWGETVNIASRMEQAGHVGMVNISETTYEYVKDYFDCIHRGKIEAKNIGKVDMYFVDRIKPEYSADKLGFIPNNKLLNAINKL